MKLFGSQMTQHGIFATFAKALQSTCAHTTVEGVVKRVIIEALSEITGVDLNLTNSVQIDSLKAIKYSIKSSFLHALAEIIKIGSLTTFYSSNLLIKVQSLLATSGLSVDYTVLIDYFRVAYTRMFCQPEAEGFTADANNFWSLLWPTLAVMGGESITSYFLKPLVKYVISLLMFGDDLSETKLTERQRFYLERYTNLVSWFVVKSIWYQFDVVNTKMHVQGTRMFVDDTTLGYGVVSVRTRFSGWMNCWRNVRLMGQTYDGYGFVMLDFMLRMAVAYACSSI